MDVKPVLAEVLRIFKIKAAELFGRPRARTAPFPPHLRLTKDTRVYLAALLRGEVTISPAWTGSGTANTSR